MKRTGIYYSVKKIKNSEEVINRSASQSTPSMTKTTTKRIFPQPPPPPPVMLVASQKPFIAKFYCNHTSSTTKKPTCTRPNGKHVTICVQLVHILRLFFTEMYYRNTKINKDYEQNNPI